MGSFFDLNFNKDDVLLRNVIIGVLATLNEKITWYNRISNDERVKISVPFYFSTTGDERFLQDHFMRGLECDGDGNPTDSFYNKIPRGIAQMGGVSIETSELTNQHVRGKYDKEIEDGTMRSYTAEFIPIPLKISFTVEIYVDSNLDQFKAMESIIRNLYKDNVFDIYVGGVRIPGNLIIPDDFDKERTVEFKEGMMDRKDRKVSFELESRVLFPVFKNAESGFVGPEDTEMFNGNRMVKLSVFDNFSESNPQFPIVGAIGTTGESHTAGIYIDNTLSSRSDDDCPPQWSNQ